ncbi:MAG: hypothetical protein AAGE52_00810 [Myxococcota bacterium]
MQKLTVFVLFASAVTGCGQSRVRSDAGGEDARPRPDARSLDATFRDVPDPRCPPALPEDLSVCDASMMEPCVYLICDGAIEASVSCRADGLWASRPPLCPGEVCQQRERCSTEGARCSSGECGPILVCEGGELVALFASDCD